MRTPIWRHRKRPAAAITKNSANADSVGPLSKPWSVMVSSFEYLCPEKIMRQMMVASENTSPNAIRMQPARYNFRLSWYLAAAME